MVDVLEFNRNMGGEVYPAADAQRRPTLTSDSTPPGQRSPSKKCNGDRLDYRLLLLEV